ncbi:DUF6481 family protein [Pelagibacterium montanilacus]|uniref:DUF6481 family protein n=1 Tax=Pelagibacterium montanilacus TaxID=2185280 RepID=UPI000F8D4536|nr:DUF6481 family protein [Pelagibacterium montanilacus]
MKSPKGSDFAERQKSSIEAKQAMLAKFNAAPKFDDPQRVAERAERAARKAERIQAEKVAKDDAAEADAAQERNQAASDAEKKAERDRKYAARKARK